MSESAANASTSGPERRGHAAVKNVLSNWVTYVFSFVVTFFLAPFIVRHLGKTGFGIWTLMSSLTGYLGLLDFGVRSAVTRFVARHHAAADHDEASRISSAALLFFVSAGLLAVLVSAIAAFLVVPHFNIAPGYRFAARVVLILSGVTVGLSLVNGVFGGIAVGLQRFDLTNRIEIVNVGVRSLVIVFALRAGAGIIGLACINFISSLAVGFALARLAFHLYPELRVHLRTPDWSRLSTIFSFSVYACLLNMSLQLIWYTDSVVIGAFLPIGMITFFAIAANLLDYARSFLRGISYTLTPMASSMEAVNRGNDLRWLTLNSSRYANIVMLPVAITFLLRGKTFIGLWMGNEYAAPSGTVLMILTLAWILNAGSGVTGSILLGISKHKPIVLMAAGEGLLNIALSIALVRRLGIYGVAWGTTIPNLIQSLIVYPWYLCRTMSLSLKDYAIFSLARPMAAMVPFALGTYLVDHFWFASNLLYFFTQVALVLPIALAGFWFGVLNSAERSAYYRDWILPFVRSFGWSAVQ